MGQVERVTGELKWGPQMAAVIQRNLERVFKNGLALTDLRCELLSASSFTLADTEYSFAHNLARVPTGYLVVAQKKAGSIRGYSDGSADNQGTAWTSTAITLVSSTASQTALIIVF